MSLEAKVMAILNRDMELAALDELAPAPDHDILAIGFGPGVGLAEAATRLPKGVVAGIDPSAGMLAAARRRCPEADVRQAAAEDIPWPADYFDGAVAVNSMQLWNPLDRSLAEVARVLKPGASLVSVTHAWAIEKRCPLDEWEERVTRAGAACGLELARSSKNRYRTGAALHLVMVAEMGWEVEDGPTVTV